MGYHQKMLHWAQQRVPNQPRNKLPVGVHMDTKWKTTLETNKRYTICSLFRMGYQIAPWVSCLVPSLILYLLPHSYCMWRPIKHPDGQPPLETRLSNVPSTKMQTASTGGPNRLQNETLNRLLIEARSWQLCKYDSPRHSLFRKGYQMGYRKRC